MKNKVLITSFLLFLFSFSVFCEEFWIEELKRNTFFEKEQIFLYEIYPESSYEFFQSIYDHAFKILGKTYYEKKNRKLLYKEVGSDIKLDDKTGYTYFYNNNKKYLIVIGDNHPFIFQDNSQSSPISISQEDLHNKKSNYEGSRSLYTFCLRNIKVSSFLTEKTKNGIWNYDGEDIERFPILVANDSKENTYKNIPMPWVEGKKGNGIGEWIEFETYGTNTLFIINGFADVRRPYLFRENNRIKNATIICTPKDKTKKSFEMKVEFQDFVYIKTIEFPEQCTKFRLVINSVYQGEKYSDTVLTSIYTKGTVDDF